MGFWYVYKTVKHKSVEKVYKISFSNVNWSLLVDNSLVVLQLRKPKALRAAKLSRIIIMLIVDFKSMQFRFFSYSSFKIRKKKSTNVLFFND